MFDPPRAFSGRVSSIIPSGTPVVRPMGHLHDPSGKAYIGLSAELDVEIELACFIGTPSAQFSRVPIEEAEDHIFGLVMLNDWSTRDVQRGEDHPFAAFNAKNFATTISPWVVHIDALEPYKVESKPQDAADVLSYLKDDVGKGTWDISIRMVRDRTGGFELMLTTPQDWTLASTGETFSPATSNLQNAYWSFKQMVVHQAFAGCGIRTGDLIGTGTLTGEDEGSVCSLVEMTKAGTVDVVSPKGTKRRYVENGDQVCYRAWAGKGQDGRKVGFGECKGLVL